MTRRNGMLLIAAVMACGLATMAYAGDVTINVTQIRATSGTGEKEFDAKLADLKRRLGNLPYKKFEFVGDFAGSAAYGKQASIGLAEGFALSVTPAQAREGRIALDASLLQGGASLLRTELVVRPGAVGLLMHPTANGATILAVSAR